MKQNIGSKIIGFPTLAALSETAPGGRDLPTWERWNTPVRRSGSGGCTLGARPASSFEAIPHLTPRK